MSDPFWGTHTTDLEILINRVQIQSGFLSLNLYFARQSKALSPMAANKVVSGGFFCLLNDPKPLCKAAFLIGTMPMNGIDLDVQCLVVNIPNWEGWH